MTSYSTYGGGGGTRSGETEYRYDPTKGTWVPVTPTYNGYPSSSSDNSNTSPDTLPSGSSDSKTEADKEYIEVEFNTLSGELNVVPSKKTIKLKVNETVEISGVGKYLSGLYFISNIKRSINKDSGYSQTLTVMKNGFGSSLKQSSSLSNSDGDREDKVDKSATTFRVGDTVKIVGNAIYAHASDGVTVPNWVKEQTLIIRQVSTDRATVLLMPINSWVYTRYIQKL